MIVRAGITVLVLIALAAGAAVPAAAQGAAQRELARELVGLLLDDPARRRLDEQVVAGLAQAIGGTLQERLGRQLLEVEWNLVARIVRRFVSDTLPAGRGEQIAADVYARHFEEAELRELLAFQRSTVARKVARLGPVLAGDTARAIDGEIRNSAAMPRMLEDLQREFPVLRAPESP
jgi:hypothetical protein